MTRTAALDDARVGRVALLVTDLAETVDFYRNVVGLEVLTRRETTATLGAGGTALLALSEDPTAPARPRESAGLYHVAFRVPSRGALGNAVNRVRDRWTVDGAADHRVSEAVYLADPEGNGVEIYCDRPREEWPVADDGTVRLDTLPLDLDDVAAGASGDPGAPTGTTVGHVHLEVSSLEAARRFYVETVGLGVRADLSPSALFLAAGEYHHHLGLNAWNRRSRPTHGRGLAWYEIVVSDEEAFAALRRRLVDAGVSIAKADGGVEVADPDGIAVRFRIER